MRDLGHKSPAHARAVTFGLGMTAATAARKLSMQAGGRKYTAVRCGGLRVAEWVGGEPAAAIIAARRCRRCSGRAARPGSGPGDRLAAAPGPRCCGGGSPGGFLAPRRPLPFRCAASSAPSSRGRGPGRPAPWRSLAFSPGRGCHCGRPRPGRLRPGPERRPAGGRRQGRGRRETGSGLGWK
ncbi:latency-related protein [bovine alphaherpesvirus 1]|uniref:Latency-related protein n=2 Tax=Bovine herpesvirus 1 TaxID=10320 RepID=Q69259_BHV1|nr:product of latency-related protein [Bovine herpesvirus type 1.1]AAA46059.1 latency-related open reading frame 2; putative [Bovine alphaherpesvirus 1]AFV53422.1 product of latency-related protein [Bovine herpesvirus type 1.1]ALR87829.1 latency-related protein [Bovine alphaherpesvirus 1]AWK60673.1 product of latency-related protein [Bovine alphaherpesvirus 1]QBH74787.1 latency-related protein [Bovine alphaherpesvirus 1]